MGEVVELGCWTKLDIPAEKVLTAAVGEVERVLVLGYDKKGEEYFASSWSDKAEVLWLIERFKAQMLSGEIG